MLERTHDRKKILLVDDEDVIRQLLARYLTEAGYHIVPARGIREGVERMDEMRFDLLITDLRLADGDGVEVIQKFKEKFPATGVLVITGSLTPDERLSRAAAWTVQECIHKPFELRVLQNAIQQALAIPDAA